MKKQNILYISMLILVFPAYSQDDIAGTFYLGANLGGSLVDTNSVYLKGESKPLSLTGGLVGGYFITDYLSAEADYSYLGQKPTSTGDENITGLSGYLATQYALSDISSLYFKLGGTMFDDASNSWSPSAGVGVKYEVNKHWLIDVGYRWIDDVPDTESDLYEFAIGGRYFFGIEKPQPKVEFVAEPEPQPEPQLVTMDTDTLFDFDSFTIRKGDVLDDVINNIIESGATVKISGYTDSVGSEVYNQALSEHRALAVKQYFIAGGIPDERISVKGGGEFAPIASNETKNGRAKNRRVEIHYEIMTFDE